MVTSPAISDTHWATVRTAWPSSMPMSHSVAKNRSMAAAGAAPLSGSRISTSTSECGKSWPRP